MATCASLRLLYTDDAKSTAQADVFFSFPLTGDCACLSTTRTLVGPCEMVALEISLGVLDSSIQTHGLHND